MMQIEDIRKNNALVNAIDWEMTPEEAVRLYLEWGSNWARGNYVIRSKDDVTHYFVVYAWEEKPYVLFIRRNSDEAEELAKIDMPQDIADRFLKSVGSHKGVYAVEGEVREWLKGRIYN